MSSYAVSSITQRNIGYSRNYKTVRHQENQSNKVVVYSLILLIIFFGILYTIQANGVVTNGYKIQKYDKELTSLRSKNNELNLKLTEIQSLKFLEESVENLNMVKISKIEYLSPVSQVAAR